MDMTPTASPEDQAMVLAQAVLNGAVFSYLPFFGHRAPSRGQIGPWVLSQWWTAPFVIDGTTYPTAEHWMMVAKADIFGDVDSRAYILSLTNPFQVKQAGRRVKNYDEATWRIERYGRIVAGNIAKFSQNPDLLQYLIDTGDRVLVEANPYDPVWGVALPARDSRISQPHQWQGLNLLGFALMQVRNILRSADC